MKETRLTVEIDRELKNKAKGKASTEGKSLKQVIILLIRQWLAG